MAAADLDVNAMIATLECDDAIHRVGLGGMNCNLVNVGASPVFLSMVSQGALLRTGAQNDGEIQLDPNDSIPLPAEASFIRHQCGAGLSTKLWYIPRAG